MLSALLTETSWRAALKDEFSLPYIQELEEFLKEAYRSNIVYPIPQLIFNALNYTPLSGVKVCILGQDPYHRPHQANGLAFSVGDTISFPPSLRNIFKEITQEMGGSTLIDGNLEPWAKNGVLLINATLTVEAGKSGSHQNKGWERFTDEVIRILNFEAENVVYMLWGSHAQKKGKIIDPTKNLILMSSHPSPLSAYRGFLGCNHFRLANEYLIEMGKTPVKW